jgi:cytochrome c-type biogenesis protein CcmE
MKPGQLFGVAVIVICIAAAGFSLRGSIRQSLTVKEVMASSGEPCSVYGRAVKGATHYDMRAVRLDFILEDDKGNRMPVIYLKPKPETFDAADKIRATGAYRDGAFQADELILKCPSKYIKNAPVPGKPGTISNPYAALGKRA